MSDLFQSHERFGRWQNHQVRAGSSQDFTAGLHSSANGSCVISNAGEYTDFHWFLLE